MRTKRSAVLQCVANGQLLLWIVGMDVLYQRRFWVHGASALLTFTAKSSLWIMGT